MSNHQDIDSMLVQAKKTLLNFICASKVSINTFSDLGANILLSGFGAHYCKIHKNIHVFSIDKAFSVIKTDTNLIYYHVTCATKNNSITSQEAAENRAYIKRFTKDSLTSIIYVSKRNLTEARVKFHERKSNSEMLKLATNNRMTQKLAHRKKYLQDIEKKKNNTKVFKENKKAFLSPANKPRGSKGSRYHDRMGLPRGSALISHLDISHENILEFYTCFRKRSHAFATTAQEALLRDHGKEAGIMNIYVCIYCTGFHVGHNTNNSVSKVIKNARNYWKAHPSDANNFIEIKQFVK
jgi:hypothetical protein